MAASVLRVGLFSVPTTPRSHGREVTRLARCWRGWGELRRGLGLPRPPSRECHARCPTPQALGQASGSGAPGAEPQHQNIAQPLGTLQPRACRAQPSQSRHFTSWGDAARGACQARAGAQFWPTGPPSVQGAPPTPAAVALQPPGDIS